MLNSFPRTIKLIRLAMVLLCLFLISCDDSGITGSNGSWSVNIDGSNLRVHDARLYGGTYQYNFINLLGYPYYFSDEEVFYVRDNITLKGLEQAPLSITPDSLQLTDKRWLGINPELRKLYFAANGDLYECGFDGNALRNLTPDNTYILINPTLSEDKRYLSAIRKVNYNSGNIVRLDIETLELIEMEVTPMASFAWYNSLQKDHYYYVQGKLFRLSENSEPELLMQSSNTEGICKASHDRRFFALLADRNLQIYDCLLDTVIDLGKCTNFAFLPEEKGLIVSKVNYEMADLRFYDPESWEYNLIYDGILSGSLFIQSIHAIDPRWDGETFFFRGYYSSERAFQG